MGLSIHYSGSFNTSSSLSEMITEVADIAAIYQWPFHIYNSRFETSTTGEEDIYGISFTPPESETISLCFLSNRRMTSNALVKYFGKSSGNYNEEILYSVSVKTQFAGKDVHMLVIKLFKYLSEKYFINCQLSDESHYWETGDEKIASTNFKLYDKLLDQVSHAFENFPINDNETIEAYFERVLKWKQRK
jgi:hypothetical protein